ncbi:hypothetical protein ABTD55_21655, partial [Acinetobacter baumannii]
SYPNCIAICKRISRIGYNAGLRYGSYDITVSIEYDYSCVTGIRFLGKMNTILKKIGLCDMPVTICIKGNPASILIA